jgi:hypothetical protein
MTRLLALLVLLGLSAHAFGQNSAPCFPRIQWPLAVTHGPIPTGVSTRYDTYAVWVCEQPGGYVTTANLFSMANVAPFAWQYVAGTWSKAQADTDCTATCVAPTASEAAFMQTVMTPAYPRAVVAFNGTSLTRNVYTTNTNGTLNPTPVGGEQVAVAARCNEGSRIVSAPNYYSVAGLPNSVGGVLPANSYTVCVVSLPIGAN